jgi:hypothetical protein
MAQDDMLVEEPTLHCLGELVPTENVKPNPDNPNVHPVEQLEILAGILKVNGWRSAIIVSRRSGMVVKGHGRLQTAKFMKLTKVPVQYQDYIDEQAEYADMIADNRVAQHSYVDAFKLGNVLKKVSAKGQETLGYSQEEIGLIMAAEYVPPETTDRKFVVLETLKMTKESKAVISRAVQRFCLRLGKEMDWGEALATICIQWEAGQPPLPEPKPEPKSEPKPKKEPKKKAEAPAPAAPATADGEERMETFKVKLVARTTLGDKDVGVVRPAEGNARYYTTEQETLNIAKLAKDKGHAVEAVLKMVGDALWITSLEKAEA